MLKKRLQRIGGTLLLCLPICAMSAPQEVFASSRPSSPPHSVAQIHSHKADTTSNFSPLMADGKSILEQINEKRNKRNQELEDAILRESLEYPAIDLYGENSWGRYVNPFVGTSTAEIPATYEIDCNGFVMPLDGNIRLTSHYGYRRRFRRMHRGVDMGLTTGDTVRAAFDGKIRIVDYEHKGYGKYVVIRHPNGLETVYGHMSRQLVRENDIVRAGEAIGLGGSTGLSTGPHLHFELRFMGIDINPTQIIDFANGAPLRDIFTFKRGSTAQAGGSYASSARHTKASSSKKAAHKPEVYRIRKGDTLSSISKKTGVSVKKLCQINKITPKTTIRQGKTLRIR